jgi:hypothetical protein
MYRLASQAELMEEAKETKAVNVESFMYMQVRSNR